jgi:predicted metalloprotease
MPADSASPRWPRVVSLVVAAVLAGACFVGSDSEGGGPGGPGGDSGGSPVSPGGEEDDGTMTVAEFRRDIDSASAVAEEYWSGRLSRAGARFQPIRRVIPYDDEGDVACGGQPLGLNNAAYCSAGDFIAYDVNWAVAAFQKIGDAFLFYLLGHEYAHGIQVRLGVEYEFTIQQELQADCMAGAYIGDSIRDNRLRLDDGDLDELRRGLFAVGDDPNQPWFAPGAHGTAEQRTEAFFSGYERSLDPCGLS